MLRLLSATIKDNVKKIVNTTATALANNAKHAESKIISSQIRCLGVFFEKPRCQATLKIDNKPLSILSYSLNRKLLQSEVQPAVVPCRNVTKFSKKKGIRKTVKTVVYRFYRLNWGAWIRTRAGRRKRLWLKPKNRRRRLAQHVFTNAQQSWLLDKMVTKYWKRPRHYPEDIYNPYHTREEFLWTQKKPKPLTD